MDDNRNSSPDEVQERPAKRPRLSFTPGSPEEVTEEWDLQAARAHNDMRLKSIFEGIFSKYGQDFTEVGDEIDLESGNIVVDNGHLLGMREEQDTGNRAQPWLYENDLADGPDSDNKAGDQEDPPEQTYDASLKRSPVPDAAGASGTDAEARSDSLCEEAPTDNTLDNLDARPISKTRQTLDPVDIDPGPRDPLWKAPDLPRIFSTPTAETRHANVAFSPHLPKLTREASPPGSGSLWAVRQPGRPRTEGKPKATPSKRRPRAKRKHHSSPVVRDWSFAATPDGDESDDPLQDNEPSPSPLKIKAMNIWGKRPRPSAQDTHVESPSRLCRNAKPGGESATKSKDDGQTLPADDVQNDAAFDAPSLLCKSSANTPALPSPPSGDSPSKSHRGFTPDEVKLLVRMRYVQGEKWKEILECLPSRTLPAIYSWHGKHWTNARAAPPPTSAPWSQADLDTLERLKDQSGLSWSEIQAELPNRSQSEIEFELLRLWVGDDVWYGETRRTPAQDDVIDSREEQLGVSEPYPALIEEQLSREEEPDAGPSSEGGDAEDGVLDGEEEQASTLEPSVISVEQHSIGEEAEASPSLHSEHSQRDDAAEHPSSEGEAPPDDVLGAEEEQASAFEPDVISVEGDSIDEEAEGSPSLHSEHSQQDDVAERWEEQAHVPEPFVEPVERVSSEEEVEDKPPASDEKPRGFEDFFDDDDLVVPVTTPSQASSPSKLSAIHLDSPTSSWQGSRTPKRPSPAKKYKFEFTF